ncbi:MAG TPA: cytochrome C [Gammaproteobacteria bacterium]|nr:cytochrome C [Gammaproteobacteria bacterium]
METTSINAKRISSTRRLLLGSMLVIGLAPAASAGLSGPLAKTVAHGRDIFLHDTFGGRGMTCDSCHTAGGKGPTVVPGSTMKGPSLSNAAAVFPRYKPDDGRVLTLAEQIHGCISGALGGKAPPYGSDTMRALETYLTALSQGKRIDMGGPYR